MHNKSVVDCLVNTENKDISDASEQVIGNSEMMVNQGEDNEINEQDPSTGDRNTNDNSSILITANMEEYDQEQNDNATEHLHVNSNVLVNSKDTSEKGSDHDHNTDDHSINDTNKSSVLNTTENIIEAIDQLSENAEDMTNRKNYVEQINDLDQCTNDDVNNSANNITETMKEPEKNENSKNDSGHDLNETDKLQLSDTDEENISPIRTKLKKSSKILSESEDDSNTETKEKTNPHQNFTSYKQLLDSESEEEYEEQNVEIITNENIHKEKVKIKHSKKVEKKLDDITAIRSETQRLTRENVVSIPYHKPKQLSLKEFMTRKTISKPAVNRCGKKLSLKMNQEELAEFSKLLEERAKEASEFYKSDTEEVKLEKIDKTAVEIHTDDQQKEEKNCNLDTQLLENESEPNTPKEVETSQAETPEIFREEITKESTSKNILNEDNLRKLLSNDSVSLEVPTLTGDPNMLIDLETGNIVPPAPSGVDKLFERFLKHTAKPKPKEKTNISIVSTENRVIEITDVIVPLTQSQTNEHKPGSSYVRLKDGLKQIILKRRKEELKKRIEETRDYESEKEEYDEFEEQDECCDENTMEDEKDVEEEIHVEEYDESDADDEYDGEDSDEDIDIEEDNKKPKKRIISTFDDSEEEENEIVIPYNTSGISEQNDDIDEKELLELCSGKFDVTQQQTVISQMPPMTQGNTIISQIPATQIGENVDENELLALCSGQFVEPNENAIIDDYKSDDNNDDIHISIRKQLETSDEDDIEKTEKPKSKKKRKPKLAFSDDESSGNDSIAGLVEKDSSESDDNTIKDDEEEAVIPETYIDYDSEENEIEVKMTKDEFRSKANEFLENEAELSESEWGSADEDEKGLDKYDIELADEENFDREQLQTELGKIHMRRILDDDIREVKKIQELLFEDEENDGVGRQRQFKWKNMDNSFNLEVSVVNDVEIKDASDEENEELWRKMRHERELLLQEKIVNKETTISTTINKSEEVISSVGKKVTIIKLGKHNPTTNEKDSPFLISKTSNRGSFLVRDKETLSKLASITKASIEEDGTIGAISVGTKKSGKFVFAAINNDDKNILKRKAVDNNELVMNEKKKPKIRHGASAKIRLLDHLI